EAGRGPVLGSMVYTIACINIPSSDFDYTTSLTDIPVADSKVLTSTDRESIAELLNNLESFTSFSKAISAQDISSQQLANEPLSLNDIAKSAVIQLINQVLSSFSISHIYVDTLGKPSFYKKFLTSEFPNINFTVASKADSLYPIVSAASIVAKVKRDLLLKQDVGCDLSGYPADPKTKQWLNNNLCPVFGWGRHVRYAWSTAEILLNEKCVKVDWGDWGAVRVAGKKRRAGAKVKNNKGKGKQQTLTSMFVKKTVESRFGVVISRVPQY
ncbi:hypothetical protein P9112_002605, partial [Eukaryota sp. TZLM1-RC]